MLALADLPPEGEHALNGPSASPAPNQSVLDTWGPDAGAKYVDGTGRLDGWAVDYRRNAVKPGVPGDMYDTIAKYQSISGAQLTTTNYIGKHFQDLGFTAVDDAPQVGDASEALTLQKGGNVTYVLGFSYRNYVHVMQISGLESEATLGFASKMASILLDKMKAAPLSSP